MQRAFASLLGDLPIPKIVNAISFEIFRIHLSPTDGPLVPTAWLRFSQTNFPWQHMKNGYSSLRILERSSLPLRTASPFSVAIALSVFELTRITSRRVKMVHLKSHFSFNCNFKATLAISLEARLICRATFPDQGLKAYFREAFSITLRMSIVSQDSKLGQSISASGEQLTSERGRDLL